MNSLARIEGQADFQKDLKTNAIVNRNSDALTNAKRAKEAVLKSRLKEQELESKINSLEQTVRSILTQLKLEK
jgi:hypothetical protein